LAIAAAKLGAARVDGVDVDRRPLATAGDNARGNGVELQPTLPPELRPGVYEVVVSNILAQPLIQLAPVLAARTAPQGALALAGIWNRRRRRSRGLRAVARHAARLGARRLGLLAGRRR
jgi:ribosomal protein L11 methyltransferase